MNGHRRASLPLAWTLAASLLAAGCCKKSPPTPSSPDPEPTETETAAPAPAPVVAAPPAASEQPLREGDLAPPTSGPRVVKEFVAVDGMSLGTIPMGVAIPPGGPAYGGYAVDAEGRRVDVGALIRAENALLLVFSRGGFCPYSNFEIRELARNASAFRSRGVGIVVITADRPPEAEKTRATYAAPFPVLSDGDLVLHDIYRVGHQADAKELKSLALGRVDVEPWSNRKHHRFAVPSLFLVNRTGRVLWSHATEDERTRPKVSQILAALDARNLPPRLDASASAAPLPKPPPPLGAVPVPPVAPRDQVPPPSESGSAQQRNP